MANDASDFEVIDAPKSAASDFEVVTPKTSDFEVVPTKPLKLNPGDIVAAGRSMRTPRSSDELAGMNAQAEADSQKTLPKPPEPKSYQATPDGQVTFTNGKSVAGLQQAVKDGILDADYQKKNYKTFQDLDAKYNEIVDAAGSDSQAMAALHGASSAGAFMAAMPAGAKVGARIGKLSPWPEFTAPVGAAIGSLTAGMIADAGMNAAIKKAGEYSDIAKSFEASPQVHPYYNAAGGLLAFGTTVPGSVANLKRMGDIAAAGGGSATTAIAKQVGKGAVGGAAVATAMPAFTAAGHLVQDAFGIQHPDTAPPSFGDYVQMVGLGMLTAGHSIEFKKYQAGDIASILVRAKLRTDAGLGLDAELNPVDVMKTVDANGGRISQAQAVGLARPLNEEEISMHDTVLKKMKEAKASGLFEDKTPADLYLEGEQALVPGVTGRRQPISSAVVGIKVRPEGEQENALNPKLVEGRVSEERGGTSAVGEARPEAKLSDSLPSPAGKPTEAVGPVNAPVALKAGDIAPVEFVKLDPNMPSVGWFRITQPVISPESGNVIQPSATTLFNSKQIESFGLKLPDAEAKKFADAQKPAVAPPALVVQPPTPESVPNYEVLFEDLRGDLDAFSPARDTGKVNYDLMDSLDKFEAHVKSKPNQPIADSWKEFKGELPASHSKKINSVLRERGLLKKSQPPIPAAPTVAPIVPPVAPPVTETRGDTKLKRVSRGLRARKVFDKETEIGGPDILSWIADEMPMLSKSAAKSAKSKEWWMLNKSLWGDAPVLKRPHHNIIYSGGSYPDVVAQEAFKAGVLKEPDVNELWSEINRASETRANIFKGQRSEEKAIQNEIEQHREWMKAIQKGEVRVTPEDLKVGDEFDVDGQRIKVIDKNEQTGTVELEDGSKFGIQKLENGESIYVENFGDHLPEGEPDWSVPEEPTQEEKPIESTTKFPKLTSAEQNNVPYHKRIFYHGIGGTRLESFRKTGEIPESRQAFGGDFSITDDYGLAEQHSSGGIVLVLKVDPESDFKLRNPFGEESTDADIEDSGEGEFIVNNPSRISILGEAEPAKVTNKGATPLAKPTNLPPKGRSMRAKKVEKPTAEIKPDLTLAPPESVEEQEARLAREAKEKAIRDAQLAEEEKAATAKRNMLEKAAGRLGGNLGSAGQGGLFKEAGDEQEIFKPKSAEESLSVNPPKPPGEINPNPTPVENIEPVKAEAVDKAQITVGDRAIVEAAKPEILLFTSSGKKHFTLWLLDNRKKRWRWEYLTILGQNKDEAIQRAIEVANRLAVGDTTGIAFFGKGQWEQPKTIGVSITPVTAGELMARDLTPVGEQYIQFGKMRGTQVKEVWDKDPGWALWAAENLSGRNAAIGNYLRERPEYQISRDANAEKIEVKKAASIDAVNPEAIATLAQFKLAARPSDDGMVVITGDTYDWKDTIKAIQGRRWDDATKAWKLPPAGFDEFLAKLRGIPKPTGERGQGAKVPKYQRDERLGAMRKAADGIGDESGFANGSQQYVGNETAALISEGAKAGMSKQVLDEQIEDVARINRAYQDKKPLFILASDPGTGKTYVLGGAIREMVKAGAKKVVWVTLRKELIKQIQDDLASYGIGDVKFITYPEMRKSAVPEDTDVLIFDEAHAIKNVKDAESGGAQQAVKAASWIEKSKFTVISSATPFENPTQAVYLEPTGVFNQDFGGSGFDFALAFGASTRTFKVKTKNGPMEKTELVWKRTTTSDTDSKAVNDYFKKRGIFTSRPIRLPANRVDARMVMVKASDEAAKIYRGFDESAEELEDGLSSIATMWVVNFKKRLLEASKIGAAIKEAESALKRGRYPIIFVETRAERKFNIPEVLEKEAEYQAACNEIRAQNQQFGGGAGGNFPLRSDWGLPPEGIPEVLGRFMEKTGVKEISIPPAEDLVLNHFGKDNVTIFSGTVTPKVAQENLDMWRASKKPRVFMATMAKGGTGLSLHDKIGNHQTTQIGVNMPWTATQLKQVAQRSARYGLVGKAEMQWLFVDNIPFDRFLASRIGGRMADMGAIVTGDVPPEALKVEDFNFEDVPFSEVGEIVRSQTGEKPAPATPPPVAPQPQAEIWKEAGFGLEKSFNTDFKKNGLKAKDGISADETPEEFAKRRHCSGTVPQRKGLTE